jgi:hypothetical protein
MKTIIGVGIDCSKNKHVVCISDNMGNQCDNIFTIHNKLKDVEYLVEKVLEVKKSLEKLMLL